MLKKIGLIDSEIKLYLALLELGAQGANILARKTDIKRANVYYFLESLKEKGLITQFSDMSGVKHFRAEKPEKLLEYIDTKEKELEEEREKVNHIIPDLKQLASKQPYDVPKVRYYEGKKSVERLYEEIFSSKEVLAIANIDSVGAIFPKYAWGLKEILPQRNIKMKELIVESKSADRYLKEMKSDFHKMKKLPKNLSFSTDILIYKKKVAYISYRQVITAFVIEDSLINEAERKIFEGLWGK